LMIVLIPKCILKKYYQLLRLEWRMVPYIGTYIFQQDLASSHTSPHFISNNILMNPFLFLHPENMNLNM
jgi:hypothetical protein